MISYRVIARLDIKGHNLIKGFQMEGLRVLGKPADFAEKYANEGADELLIVDTVASLYGRNQIQSLIEDSTSVAFIPISVAGGVQSVDGAKDLLRWGADRIALNSGAIRSPQSISEIASRMGCQAVAVSIEAKRKGDGWEAYTDCGRIPSGKCVIEWAREAERLGAGEILITSVDQDGTRRGPDWELIRAIETKVPFVYSGGVRLRDVAEIAQYTQGVAIGATLHYGDCTIADIKQELRLSGQVVR